MIGLPSLLSIFPVRLGWEDDGNLPSFFALPEGGERVVARHASASIVITCFPARRWSPLAAAVDSAIGQTLSPQEVIVVVDGNDELLSRVEQRWPQITVMANRFDRGASGARNTGAFAARSPVVAFLDDDTKADPKWLELLVQCFEDDSVVGVGGGVSPAWADCRAAWFL